ncbi:single-stranded DNA-binding protein [Novosphingobium sp. Gsoil 351]|uniref:single-stranded DNA-binding protein n=1 Tax=Novosphingobium sp. Gsoil 351 TaxID=2675225 RepID=UPI0012B49B7A|nr:single-stranded DNA-binding protein [Novosphingobium sp. Gsoil 351]QGN55155.1 single-stranded DNA-binding protein [Novosphingobium sp. Gsoil 351]
MKNTVTLVGFVGNAPEIRNLPNGATVTSVWLATSRNWKDADGKRQSETEWHRVTCFNGIGKAVAEHVAKGTMIMVTGRLHYTRWTDSEGQVRHGCEIVAEQVDFLAKAKAKAETEPLLV